MGTVVEPYETEGEKTKNPFTTMEINASRRQSNAINRRCLFGLTNSSQSNNEQEQASAGRVAEDYGHEITGSTMHRKAPSQRKTNTNQTNLLHKLHSLTNRRHKRNKNSSDCKTYSVACKASLVFLQQFLGLAESGDETESNK